MLFLQTISKEIEQEAAEIEPRTSRFGIDQASHCNATTTTSNLKRSHDAFRGFYEMKIFLSTEKIIQAEQVLNSAWDSDHNWRMC